MKTQSQFNAEKLNLLCNDIGMLIDLYNKGVIKFNDEQAHEVFIKIINQMKDIINA